MWKNAYSYHYRVKGEEVRLCSTLYHCRVDHMLSVTIVHGKQRILKTIELSIIGDAVKIGGR
jgi:hypothetical protein